MRDAQSLLDQLLAFGGDRLTAEQVHRLLGTAGDDRVLELAAAILDKEPARPWTSSIARPRRACSSANCSTS